MATIGKGDYRQERAAIIAIRKRHPHVGVWTLARRIFGLAFKGKTDNADASVVFGRPFYSILGVIRRYDRRGYYAAIKGV